MVRPAKLPSETIDSWLEAHPGWRRAAGNGADALVRTFVLPDFSAALALAVRVGLLAEKHDHHPDLQLGWGKLEVLWSTHDAGGITALDVQLAEGTDRLIA